MLHPYYNLVRTGHGPDKSAEIHPIISAFNADINLFAENNVYNIRIYCGG